MILVLSTHDEPAAKIKYKISTSLSIGKIPWTSPETIGLSLHPKFHSDLMQVWSTRLVWELKIFYLERSRRFQWHLNWDYYELKKLCRSEFCGGLQCQTQWKDLRKNLLSRLLRPAFRRDTGTRKQILTNQSSFGKVLLSANYRLSMVSILNSTYSPTKTMEKLAPAATERQQSIEHIYPSFQTQPTIAPNTVSSVQIK